MEDLPLRDLEQQVFQVRKKITNKLPEVAGDGLDLKIVQNGTLGGKNGKHAFQEAVFFFSCTSIFLIQMLSCMKYFYLHLPHFMVLMKVIFHTWSLWGIYAM